MVCKAFEAKEQKHTSARLEFLRNTCHETYDTSHLDIPDGVNIECVKSDIRGRATRVLLGVGYVPQSTALNSFHLAECFEDSDDFVAEVHVAPRVHESPPPDVYCWLPGNRFYLGLVLETTRAPLFSDEWISAALDKIGSVLDGFDIDICVSAP